MKKILVADDDENIVSTLKSILEIEGYTVITASNGTETLERVRTELPDLVILDLMMPELDGASVAFDLQHKTASRNIPIIFISGMIASGAGAPAPIKENVIYISKPFEVSTLLSAVNKVLKED